VQSEKEGLKSTQHMVHREARVEMYVATMSRQKTAQLADFSCFY